MIRDVKRLLIITCMVALAGCSGGGKDSGGGEIRPEQVAVKLGCAPESDSTDELFVRELGKCTYQGEEMRLYTFADNEARDNWLKVARGFGGRYVVLDRAIISSDTDSASLMDTVADKVGGRIG